MEEPIRKKIIKKKVVESLTIPSEFIKLTGDKDKDKAINQAYFESIHNLLWNAAGLNADKAMEHMNLFFAYRLIEPQLEKIGVFPKECRWSYISSLTSVSDIYNALKEGYKVFTNNEKTNPFFYFKIEIKKETIVADMIKQVNRISDEDIHKSDILGSIFEYMIGRGMSTMADEGQYFTHRKVCELAFKLCYNIKKNLRRDDGTLCTFADWFCGTGGFASEYVKGVNKILKHDINWLKDMESVYCIDKNSNSISNTLLNLLICTGVPFNRKKIIQHDSFHESITRGAGALFEELTIDYCFMNPPYGGDKTKGKEYKFKYTNGKKGTDKKVLVNKDIESIGIEDDDKVSAGVQLGMATLSKDGVCALVLPQGFFFGASKKSVELRKKLIEEYNVHYVVDIPSGLFENTATKTSMIVFQAGSQTKNIKFIDMNQTLLVEATLEQIQSKNYGLNYKQYIKQEDKVIEGFEMVKLGDICEWQMGKRIVKEQVESGNIPVYGGGGITFHTNISNRTGINCKISREGMSEANCVIIINGEYYQNSQGMTVISKDTDKLLNSYLWNWLVVNKNKVYDCGHGTAQKAIQMHMLNDIQIPIPSIEKQQHIVDSIDGWAQLAQQEEESLKLLEKLMMFEVMEMGIGKERVKLGDVCEIESGTYITKKTATEGVFPVYGGGDISCRISNFNRESKFVIAKDGVSETCVRYVPGKFFLNHHGWTFACKDTVLYSYLGYWLLNNQKSVYELATGTAQKGINQVSFYGLEIPLPPITEQQTLQTDFDEIQHKYAKIAYYKAKAQEAIEKHIPGAKE